MSMKRQLAVWLLAAWGAAFVAYEALAQRAAEPSRSQSRVDANSAKAMIEAAEAARNAVAQAKTALEQSEKAFGNTSRRTADGIQRAAVAVLRAARRAAQRVAMVARK